MAAQDKTENSGKPLRLQLAVLLVLLQIIFFTGWFWTEYNRSGKLIQIEVVPFDPRDLLRGQYMQLAYKIENPENYENSASNLYGLLGEKVYVVLDAEDGVYKPAYFFFSDPGTYYSDNRLLMAGKVARRGSGGSVYFDFGISRYFVPEGTPEPGWGNAVTAEVLVDINATPRLKRLLVNGEALVEEKNKLPD